MKLTKLVPAIALFSFALSSLACPTRPADMGAGGDAGAGGDGTAGANSSGAGGVAGRSASGGAGAAGGVAGGAAMSGAGGVATGGAGGAATGGSGGSGGTGGVATGGAGGTAGVATGGAGGTGGASAGSPGTAGTDTGAAGADGVRDGQPCAISADCASRLCSPFYVDVDGDGYGTGQAVGFCGANSPVGYAAQSGDCCDSASNLALAKLIHPGADFQTTSAGGICNITWDYDCSGTVESNPQMLASCGSAPPCTGTIASYPESSCGTPNNKSCGCAIAGPGCTMACSGHPDVTIACK